MDFVETYLGTHDIHKIHTLYINKEGRKEDSIWGRKHGIRVCLYIRVRSVWEEKESQP